MLASFTVILSIVYTFIFRHILASLHFNYNLHRDTVKDAEGNSRVKVVWPKFKNGEGTIREIHVKPNFGK